MASLAKLYRNKRKKATVEEVLLEVLDAHPHLTRADLLPEEIKIDKVIDSETPPCPRGHY